MKSNIMSHFRITNDQNKLLPTKLCLYVITDWSMKRWIIKWNERLGCLGTKELLEGWEEEEIIDKKDSAEGRTSNLPYRNSVVCNVSIPQTIANRGEPLSSKL
ncbi:hypothetical protein GQR58_020914 [Nymphon striatum]|nr:hypothetical protein GQR58_020914 [Nymphon striatum]